MNYNGFVIGVVEVTRAKSPTLGQTLLDNSRVGKNNLE